MSLLESFNVGHDYSVMVVTVVYFDFEGGSCKRSVKDVQVCLM